MKIAIVTGGTDGVGFAVVKKLVQQNYFVYAIARNKRKLTELTEIEKKQLRFVSVDLEDHESVESFFKFMKNEEETLDALINNAGGFIGEGNLDDLNFEDWQRTFALNCTIPALFIKNCLELLKNSRSPSILNIASTTALDPGTWNPHYSCSKAALTNLTVSMAKSLSPNIRVNTLSPGPVETQGLVNQKGYDENSIKNRLLLDRVGKPEDIANAVEFLISESNSWVTGSHFIIDGGRLCHI